MSFLQPFSLHLNAPRRQRLILVSTVVVGVSLAVALILYALQQNINLFYSPTQIINGQAPLQRMIRVGGLVVKGSVERDPHNLNVRFVLTDLAQQLTVQYQGILPDLFREGQGIVARGILNADGSFHADEVLAKHDENYMPPEVAASLQQAGLWQHSNSPPAARE